MKMADYVLAMTSLMNSEEGFNWLLMALEEIDEVPGEFVLKEILKEFAYYESVGLEITGFSDDSGKTVFVLK